MNDSSSYIKGAGKVHFDGVLGLLGIRSGRLQFVRYTSVVYEYIESLVLLLDVISKPRDACFIGDVELVVLQHLLVRAAHRRFFHGHRPGL